MHRGIVLKSFFTTFVILLESGRVAEWLGRALQKLVQRFESARDLNDESRAGESQRGFLFSKHTKTEGLQCASKTKKPAHRGAVRVAFIVEAPTPPDHRR